MKPKLIFSHSFILLLKSLILLIKLGQEGFLTHSGSKHLLLLNVPFTNTNTILFIFPLPKPSPIATLLVRFQFIFKENLKSEKAFQ